MFDEILRQAMSQNMRESGFPSRLEACEAMTKFLNRPKTDIKEGDFVERNEFGRRVYNVPGDNQAAKCIKFLDEPVRERGDLNDMQICVAIAPDVFGFYFVDSRYFRVAGSRTNVTQFGRRPI